MNPIDKLLLELDSGQVTRRDLLRALGLAALAVPAVSFAQGGDSTARRGRGNRAPGDTTHAPAPFDPTGWRTVWLDHITYQCTDYAKAAAFYAALMGWKVRSDDGQRAVLDIGDDLGGIIMTNGFVPPPPAPNPPANDSAGGSRGGGRGGGGARAPRTARITNLAWGIESWDTNTVDAELKRRGSKTKVIHLADFLAMALDENSRR